MMKERMTENINHQIFISYSNGEGNSTKSDRHVADMICSKFESENIRCWIDYRDIAPGEDWLNAIIDAVIQAKIVVLVFSSNSDKSTWVAQEVTRALRENIKIIPFRIENVSPKGTLRALDDYCQWMDALELPLKKHIDQLLKIVKKQLEKMNRSEVDAKRFKFEITEPLFIMPGSDKVIVNLHKKNVIRMGRKDDSDVKSGNDIHFRFHNVSRNHLKLRFKDFLNRAYIQDLGSSFGTFVNERRLHQGHEFELKSGDIIRLGKLILFEFINLPAYLILKNVTQWQKRRLILSLSDESDRNNLPEKNMEIVFIKSCSPIIIPGTNIKLEIDKESGSIVCNNEIDFLCGKILI